MGNGSTKPGDALRDKLADDFMKSQAERRAALKALRDSDWELDSSVNHIEAQAGSTIIVGDTGKHQAVKKGSDPPSSSFPAKVAKPVTSVLGAVKGWPQVAALAVIVIGFVAWLVLRR
jgi:hypothetical protein